ncbi:uncharacterized protein LOC112466232 [Temnothorax curvispinosus]|uniref:Uncharacterized protein LOC112466232 n=1 Tax=Temnothorax curvispinosus TaxID=300111 RepID=A0A6J1R5S8_9HYME|nr:uncharacterized protein LOC112466232 [Temnothorax curvispinosus]
MRDVSSYVYYKKVSKERGISYQDGNCILLDRRCRDRRKSRTCLKIFEETHRIVPRAENGGAGERGKRKAVATGVRMKISRGTHALQGGIPSFDMTIFPVFEAMRAQSPLSFSCPV